LSLRFFNVIIFSFYKTEIFGSTILSQIRLIFKWLYWLFFKTKMAIFQNLIWPPWIWFMRKKLIKFNTHKFYFLQMLQKKVNWFLSHRFIRDKSLRQKNTFNRKFSKKRKKVNAKELKLIKLSKENKISSTWLIHRLRQCT